MMPGKTQTPALRFAGFTGDWVERRLGEIMEVASVKRIRQSDWRTDGIRFLRARDIVAAFKNEEISDYLYISKEKYEEFSSVSGKVEVGDLLVTGVGTIGVPYLIENSDPVYFKDGNIIWFKNGKKINDSFLYFSFVGRRIQNFINDSAGIGTVGTYTIESGKKTPIVLPCSEEQSAIGRFFRKVDALIAQQQKKVEKLQGLKKGLMRKMFPRGGRTLPEVRFAGFDEEWMERKLGSLTDITTGALDANAMTPDGEYDFYTCSLQVYKIDQYAFEGPAITIAGNGYVGCLHLADGKFNAYQRTYILSNFKACREFLYEEIGRELPAKVTREARNGNIPYIVRDMLTGLEVSLPCSDEQTSIGRLFRKLDTLITLHGQKLEKLRHVKQALLGRMFV